MAGGYRATFDFLGIVDFRSKVARAFWAELRFAPDKFFAKSPQITTLGTRDQSQLFVPLFEQADTLVEAEKPWITAKKPRSSRNP